VEANECMMEATMFQTTGEAGNIGQPVCHSHAALNLSIIASKVQLK